jgi:hypothetical protein
VRPIPPRPDLQHARLDSEDLVRLAHLFSGSLQLECPKCRVIMKPSVANRELRMGSSPDLSAIDPRQPSRPRLIFYCTLCQRPFGFVQGESWTAERLDSAAEGTRWSHLEMSEENPAAPRLGDFDLDD